ncbi:MAG: hypothetical protein ACKO7U_04945, partial [Actinomycetota bacterium]
MDPVAARTALTHERDRLQRDLAHLRGDDDAEPRDSADRLDAGPDDAVATYDHEFDESVALMYSEITRHECMYMGKIPQFLHK